MSVEDQKEPTVVEAEESAGQPHAADDDSAEPAGTESTDSVGTESVEPAGRRRSPVRLALLGVCVLAIITGGVFGGLAWHQQSIADEREEALGESRRLAAELLSYDYRDLEQSLDRRTALLTGDFRDRYRSMVQDSVLPAARSQKVETTAKIVSSAVVGGDGDQVTVLLFINQTSKAPSLSKPLQTGSRVELTLRHDDGRWLTSNLKPV